MPTFDDAFMARRSALVERGLDPAGQDDTVLGVQFVYCHSHLRAHSTGWCTVHLDNKSALSSTEERAATDEARAMGLYIDGDPRPCVHCGAMVVDRVHGIYRDPDGNDRCFPDKKRSPLHTPHDRF